MTEKAKRRVSRLTQLNEIIKWGFITIGVSLCGLCVCLLMVVVYMQAEDPRTSPDASLLLTAEYLYEHPQSAIELTQADSHNYGSERSVRYCSLLAETSNWTEVFLNGGRVAPLSLYVSSISSGGPLRSPELREPRPICFEADLNPGLHLVEIQLRQNPWDAPVIYQWVIKVKE